MFMFFSYVVDKKDNYKIKTQAEESWWYAPLHWQSKEVPSVGSASTVRGGQGEKGPRRSLLPPGTGRQPAGRCGASRGLALQPALRPLPSCKGAKVTGTGGKARPTARG